MKKILKATIGLSLLFLLNACHTYSLQEGIQSFRNEEYRKAFVRLKPEAIKGQRDAQYAVGYMYYYGVGVVENRRQAWYWINTAASLGQPQAIEAVHLLQQGSLKKQKIFSSLPLQNYPVKKDIY